MSKSRDAFRTISEVSTALDTPAHVLRFWESKFSQVKPVKRAGGRRYYRPGDMNLLAGIKQLLHEDGMTIKGAQKLLREQGVKHVAKLGETALLAPAQDDIEEAVEPAAPVTPDEPASTTASDVPDKPVAPEAPEEMPDETPAVEAEVDITNVVSLQPTEPSTGPALTLNLFGSPKADEQPASPPPADAAPSIQMPDVPADPSDSDSKATARVFHLLQKAPPSKLAAQREKIAPLLDQMQVLRERIAAR